MAGSDLTTPFDPTPYPILAPGGASAELLEVMQENLGDGSFGVFDLDRIKIPTSGGSAWEVPTINGPEYRKVIEGVVVLWSAPRAYWEKGLDDPTNTEGNVPPDCSSSDGKIGYGAYGVGSTLHPDGDCRTCPMNEWGSDPKSQRGKACAEQRLLMMLFPGSILPVGVSLPPTSISAMKKYFLRLTSASVPYYGLVTRIGLEQSKNAQGLAFSVAVPESGPALDKETRARAKAYGDDLRRQLDEMPRTTGIPASPEVPEPVATPESEPAAKTTAASSAKS